MKAERDTESIAGGREPIAVVGSGMRFPGSSSSPSKLWKLLLKPRDLLSRIPENRFNADSFYHPNSSHHGTTDVQESYFLEEDHRHFDAAFFNIKPVEAHAIDPQQRLLMEVVYESLEASGMTMESLAGSPTGVYVGLMCADYAELVNSDVNALPTYTPTGNARSIMSNRISYFFDWHGPSMTIDTACSSSLVAVHEAVQLLRSGDSDVAIAAGSNLMLAPLQYIAASKLKMLSADSRSRMWDANASGYARGEGVAAVVLKRLSSAIADGDHIECIIRETAINQDGRTKGITMPSSKAQADLIAKTYAKAGLDPRNPDQRCQYFEAHGTGTAAGDPKEAEAISKAFFHPGEVVSGASDPLYVGSIKTVIGHTEGTAGLAGLLRASLAVQHGTIPPNMLFDSLHPNVEPFYTNLKIATEPTAWPKLAEGTSRRCSINSFGFGGTNAHAIVENYVPPAPMQVSQASPGRQFTPFTFSAASERSLRGVLADYAEHLRLHPNISLHDLAYTLHARRSGHAVRTHVSADSVADLHTKIDGLLRAPTSSDGGSRNLGLRSRPWSSPLRALGVFTGQGAQWATMGRELVLHSQYCRDLVRDVDRMLQLLPEAERPDWSVMDQVTCDAPLSRIDSAVISQPLCTVVQIMLFDLLTSAGVRFQAVVGHSSGEIAAAYAAGYLTRDDAVKVAYYRGYFTSLTPSDRPGAMMAVGTSAEDANELCNLSMFKGRLAVAAINSSSSVTISGDRDAVEQAKEVLEDEKKFARILKVDKAYHSHHMLPCAEEYLRALERSGINPLQGRDDCVWHSSTYENRHVHGARDLAGQYWADNMVRPVLFSHCVDAAAAGSEARFDFAVELGPHPTLKGPALQTIQEAHKVTVPYTGLLQRGKDDVQAFSDALGYLWSQFSPSIVDLGAFDTLVSGIKSRKMLQDLPAYHWDHDNIFWHKSRPTKAFLTQKSIPHPLLGTRTTDVMDEQIRWRNHLLLNELPWIRGHQLQGQVIYPATAYLSTAIEAAMFLVPEGASAQLVEVRDFNLGKPLIFGEDGSGIETVFTLSDITKGEDKTYSASFTYHACSNADAEQLSTHATGRVIVITGEASAGLLPSQSKDLPNLVDIPEDRFYKSLETVGYGYSGDFRAMSSIQRKLNFSSSRVRVPLQEDDRVKLMLHPAMLDTALQGIFLAYCWPGDGSLDQLHVPTGIQSCRVNAGLCRQQLESATEVTSSSQLTGNPLVTKNLNGNVEISTEDGSCLVQMEGLKVVSFSEPTAEADRAVFTEYVWDVLAPDAERAMQGKRATAEDYELAFAIERVSVYYMRQLASLFPEETRSSLNLEWHFVCLFNFITHVLSTTGAGQRKTAKKEWLQDSAADIERIKERYADTVDMRLARAVGDNLPAVIRGETTMLEHITKDNLLDRFYEVGLGLKEFSGYVGKTVEQVVHRHPHMKMLEIGAGTGGATKVIMGGIGRAFSSYTYTDISPNFFETASEVFSSVADKMIFKTLDVEKDIVQQGYEEHSYDLVVASLVLHATKNLKQTLANTRRLLRPGGYLVIQEVCNNEPSRTGFMMCALPGWWLGQDDGRKLSPCVSTPEWNDLLLQTGFSGVDSTTHELDSVPFQLAVIVSQAVDERVSLLREPLALVGTDSPVAEHWDLVLVGGQSPKSSHLIEEIVGMLQSPNVSHTIVKTVDDIDSSTISETTAILFLEELDKPVFKGITERTLEGLKRLFETQRTVLWVTQGSRSADPYMGMSVGLGRTLILENPDLVLQFLDLEPGIEPEARTILEALLRLRQSDRWAKEGGTFEDVLWTNEHELAYINGELCLSRVHLAAPLNDRFNASKRTVLEAMNPQSVPMNLSLGQTIAPGLVLNDHLASKMLGSPDAVESESETVIRVSHSLLMPDLATIPPSYLVLGTNTGQNGRIVLAISETNGSYASVPPGRVLDVAPLQGEEPLLLSRLHTQLQVDGMLSICEDGSVLAIHEPPVDLASAIVERGASLGIHVYITTAASPSDRSWTQVHSYSPRTVVKSLLPPDISVFIDYSTRSLSQRAGSLIASCLPETCLKTTSASLPSLRRIRGFSVADMIDNLKGALPRALEKLAAPESSTNTLPLIRADQLGPGSSDADLFTPAIVAWNTTGKVPVQVSTVDSHTTFRSDRTYVFFGLTSDLAQSICDWMVTHGARNIVLTSRHPNIDARWKRTLKEAGVRVEVFSNDITDKAALVSLVDHIRQNLPPIAGIAHGAMVLNDVSFFEMTFEKMIQVIRPKVQGAIYLDELFQEPTLDFCIFFSSCTAIAGNRGQSAYTAANMFMSSLASQRREKGLAGSILHIGAVMGVGYINRGFKDYIFTALSRAGYMMVSEREFHLCFGEAVLASHPKSGRNPDVVTALETSKFGDTLPLWAKFPRFQYCLAAADSGSLKQAQKKHNAAVSTKLRLAEATTAEEALEIVQDSFYQKLQVVLQISPDTEKSQVLASGTDDLGIDSLVAVEIRSWFIKEIDTEIAVFKVLSGISIAELVEFAVENMPGELTPNMSDSLNAVPETPTAPVIPASPPSGSVSSAPSSDPPKTTAETSQHLSESSSKTSQPDEKQSEERDSSTASLEEPLETAYEKVLPVSPGQARFWFLKHLMEDQTTANNTILVSVQGQVRLDSLDAAVRRVGARHESLRTSFFVDKNQKAVQAISDSSRLYLQTKEIHSEAQVEAEFEALKNHAYDLINGECMQLIHLGMNATESYLLIGSHHIVMDGISLEVFLNDVQKAYNGQSLSSQVYQYSDYSEKLRQELGNGAMQKEIEYWRSEFAEAPTPLPLLPFAAVKQRKALTAYRHTSVSRTVDAKVARQISDTCRKLKANVFHFYLGVFEVLLFKLFGKNDVCIGMADANRWDDQVAQSIGMYLNLLPLRFRLDKQQSFETVLKDTRRKAYNAMSNSRLPFDALLDNLNCDRSTAFSPLFQAFINYRQGVRENRTLGSARGVTKKISLPRAGYDMSLDIIENPGGDTRLAFMLQDALYSEEETAQVLELYCNLLSELSGSPGQILKDVSLFTRSDVDKAVQLGRGAALPSQGSETLVHRIDAMIANPPQEIALRDHTGRSWTWEQLGQQVNRMASTLLQVNVTAGSVIAVHQEASPDLVFSLLAILRVGGIYVPLDSNLPEARLRSIITECDPSVLLLDQTTLARAGDLALPPSVTVLDVSSLPPRVKDAICPTTARRATDPAAILFTSGSTGVPKGVILSHGGLRNHVEALVHTHGFGRETVLQQSSVGFDMSLNQIFMSLANGGTLVLVPEPFRKDSAAVAKMILEQNITYTSATPSEYLAWLRHGSNSLFQSTSWRFATAGGEQFTPQLLEAFQTLGTQFEHPFHAFNAYGPTECTLSSNEMKVSLEASSSARQITAGKALPNCSFYVVDDSLDPLPVGWPGEILIGGAGVALGYLNNPAETARKFLVDPKASSSAMGQGWGRMYRTGDKGVLRPDGTLQILGRIEGDTQIKLRGLRIEMQDVEKSILDASEGQISEVGVTPRGDPTILVAHVVLSRNASFSNKQQYLRDLSASLPLPQYMRPAAIIPIDCMPLTASGKVDRRALQGLELSSTRGQSHIQDQGAATQLTEAESELAQIWKDVLPQQLQEVHLIDGASDFFQVGGNSMLLIELRRLVASRLQVDIPLLRLFESSTLGAMAAVIQDLSTVAQVPEVGWEAETQVPSSWAQGDVQPAHLQSHSSPRTVVITGATGFLGKQLVRLLVADANIHRVHCIAVRNVEKLAEFAGSDKVSIHPGDLAQPRCGLSEADAVSIFRSTDAIIHNGADVSFLKSYSSLRAPNVLSTKELVKLSLPRLIPLHYVSTATVGKLNRSDTLAPESLARFPPGATFSDGYAASKWASEVFLENATKKLGLPTFIHRPSSITGDQAAENDIVPNLLKYSSLIKALPDTAKWSGYVDLISVERAAAGIIGSVLQDRPDLGTTAPETQFLHQTGEKVIPAQSIKAVLSPKDEPEWDSLAMAEWVSRAVQKGMNPLIGEFLLSVDRGQGLSVGQKLLLKTDQAKKGM